MNPRALASFLACAGALAVLSAPARAGDAPVDLAATVTLDLAVAIGDHRPRALGNVDLTATADLDKLVGWHGARAFAYVLDNRGGRPNVALGSLEGIDNIEVADAGTRLFEAWIEQELGGGATVKAGLVDLNSEFYVTDAANLLLGPPFGIGSEFAATGSAGPSIFPSSALAIRAEVPIAGGRGYVRAGVFNARAQTFGDPGGVDLSFREGVLVVGEGGWTFGPVNASLGVWGYTKAPRAGGTHAHGVYAMVEAKLSDQLALFARGGVSDGRTGIFSGSFNGGLRLKPVFSARDNSDFSIGFHQAWVAGPYTAANPGTARIERGVEITYADRVTRWLTVQPDLHWVHDATAPRNALLGTLRLVAEF